jgi:hypothetical protein
VNVNVNVDVDVIAPVIVIVPVDVIALVNGNANVGVIDAIVNVTDTVNDAQRVGRPERYARGTELLECATGEMAYRADRADADEAHRSLLVHGLSHVSIASITPTFAFPFTSAITITGAITSTGAITITITSTPPDAH